MFDLPNRTSASRRTRWSQQGILLGLRYSSVTTVLACSLFLLYGCDGKKPASDASQTQPPVESLPAPGSPPEQANAQVQLPTPPPSPANPTYPKSEAELKMIDASVSCHPDADGTTCIRDYAGPESCFVNVYCRDLIYEFPQEGEPSYTAHLSEEDWIGVEKSLRQSLGKPISFHTPPMSSTDPDLAATQGGDMRADFYQWKSGGRFITLVQYKGHSLSGADISNPFTVHQTETSLRSDAMLSGVSSD